MYEHLVQAMGEDYFPGFTEIRILWPQGDIGGPCNVFVEGRDTQKNKMYHLLPMISTRLLG